MNGTRKGTLWIAALLFLSVIKPAVADILLVPEDHATIAEALGVASYGDAVSLAVGSYFEHDLVLPPGVSVLGRGSRESVVIDAQGGGRVMWGEDLDANNVLESFTLRGGNLSSGDGSGAYLSGTVILRNLLVEENVTTSGSGAGIYALHALLVEDCAFRYNRVLGQWTSGGGLYISSPIGLTATIRRVIFIGNESRYGAACFATSLGRIRIESVGVFENTGLTAIDLRQDGEWSEFLIENSVVAHNEAEGISASASGTILNCTIVHCHIGVLSMGYLESPSYVNIDNSIIAFNMTDYGGGIVCNTGGGYAFLSCSDVYGNLPVDFFLMSDPTGTDGNISEDPLLCPDSGPVEYLLREDSPCASANNSCGLLMGAFPVGCGVTATDDTSWSRIKRLY